MHGNEPLGIEVVSLFKKKPIRGVDTILANKRAIKRGSRFIENDLNRAFPGQKHSKDYETRRASYILGITKSYDIVLDFHNTHCPDNDCSFLGQTANQKLYDVSNWLGISRVIVADYDCINKYAPNCLSVEISLSSSHMNPKDWYEKIAQLTSLKTVPRVNDIKKYRFVYRMTLDDKKLYNLPAQRLKAFRAIDQELAKSMGVNNPAYPIFIGDAYTPYNYGGLVNRLR
jgi:hypothetical protein